MVNLDLQKEGYVLEEKPKELRVSVDVGYRRHSGGVHRVGPEY